MSSIARWLYASNSKQCSALEDSVKKWRAYDVSVPVKRKILNKADQLYVRKRHEGTWKDVREAFILSMSEATGADLWIDGGCIRGVAADREAVQAKLEEQVKQKKGCGVAILYNCNRICQQVVLDRF